jgi:hypothetical protein
MNDLNDLYSICSRTIEYYIGSNDKDPNTGAKVSPLFAQQRLRGESGKCLEQSFQDLLCGRWIVFFDPEVIPNYVQIVTDFGIEREVTYRATRLASKRCWP